MDERNECIIYEFGSFRADALRRQLFLGDKPLPLTSKAFDTLLSLIRHRGATVSKAELIDFIWADAVVEENNLTQQISAVRKVLGESPGDHKFIVTVPGRGYSFIAPVKQLSDPEHTDVVIQEITKSNVTIDLFTDRKRTTAKIPLGLRAAAALTGALLIVIFAISWFDLGKIHKVPRTMAVLPFDSLDGREDYLGVGIRDTLTAKLGNLRELNIRPTNSALKYSAQDLIAAGRELNVDTILDGTVQHDGEQVRVTVRITDVADGKIIWGKSFDQSTSDAFAMQDLISAEVVQVLQTRLHPHLLGNSDANRAF